MDCIVICLVIIEVIRLKDNPEDAPNFFHKMVDELVEFAEFDPELKDGMQWLDSEAYKKNVSFYDMVFEILYKHDMNERARHWVKEL